MGLRGRAHSAPVQTGGPSQSTGPFVQGVGGFAPPTLASGTKVRAAVQAMGIV